jgi:hypothetical protein
MGTCTLLKCPTASAEEKKESHINAPLVGDIDARVDGCGPLLLDGGSLACHHRSTRVTHGQGNLSSTYWPK